MRYVWRQIGLVVILLAMSLSPALAQRDPQAVAEALVTHLIAGDFEAAVADFSAEMQQALPPATLQELWDSLEDQAGAFQDRVGDPQLTDVGGTAVVVITLQFESALLDMQAAVGADDTITGLYFRPSRADAAPAEQPEAVPTDLPDYVDPEAYQERAITLNAETEWELPGTLTLPVGEGPFPAAVLVHGSGPTDRDETIGANKPFRDLAWGLASQGIAVLRFDKRSYVHGEQMADLPDLTVEDEIVRDAVAALDLLRETDRVDSDRLFIVGHSLGGHLAPRIARDAGDVAGIVILAGNVRPLHHLIVTQTGYLLQLDGDLSEDDRAQLEQIEQVKQAIDSLDPAAPGAYFGAPASYWIDLRDYDPLMAARSLDLPLLIVQGERDYQVTMEDFKLWQQGLAGQDGVTFISYARLNHLMMAGEGPSTPQEYEQPGTVDADLVADVSGWILEN